MKVNSSFIFDNSIQFWEIGASGGLKSFHEYDQIFSYTGFEPNQQAANQKRKLLASTRNLSSIHVHEFGLASEEYKKLYICRHAGCSSLLKPNINYINSYKGSRFLSKSRLPWRSQFDIVDEKPIKYYSPKDLNNLKINVNPDVIQIDIQGLEYEVISNFPNLEDVLLIDIELSCDELYINQSKFDRVCNILFEKGFQLLDIKNQNYAPKLNVVDKNLVDRGELIQFDGIFFKIPCADSEDYLLKTFKAAIIMEVYGYYTSAIHFYELALSIDINGAHHSKIRSSMQKVKKRLIKENSIILCFDKIKQVINFCLKIIGSRHRLNFFAIK